MEQASASDQPAAEKATSTVDSGRAERLRELRRVAATIGLTALILGVADLISSQIFILLLFGGPTALLGFLAVGAATAIAIIATVRLFTDSKSIAGPMVVTVLAGSVGATALLTGNLTPIPGEPATPAVHLLICVGCALVLGLFIGPGLFTIVGGLAGLGMLIYVLMITNGGAELDSTVDSTDREQRVANFEQYLSEGTHPLTTDDPRWDVGTMRWQGSTSFISRSGGIVKVLVERPNDQSEGNLDAYMCMRLVQRFTGERDTAATLDSWADRCEKREDSWLLPGTGLAWVGETGLIFATQYKPYSGTEAHDRLQLADIGEIEALRPHLRSMTEDELQQAFEFGLLGPGF